MLRLLQPNAFNKLPGLRKLVITSLMLVLVALRYKRDGDRPVCLLSYLYRALVRYDRNTVRAWERQLDNPWDYAVSKSGASSSFRI